MDEPPEITEFRRIDGVLVFHVQNHPVAIICVPTKGTGGHNENRDGEEQDAPGEP